MSTSTSKGFKATRELHRGFPRPTTLHHWTMPVAHAQTFVAVLTDFHTLFCKAEDENRILSA
ncbi:hypothetical protein N7452_003840 [Penicillium brevicompactum]|uniref:Uncharacterized protein n=1 Tax=Penicillium brevicompactum TaxID=5074 RepID=A0A9W9UKJ3_PENBR|nr:hypothetical protein N7452_003840 [Penicillium brevicompactum]